MDGVRPRRCVEWRWCVLLLSRPVRWCGSCPTHPTAVLISTAVMSCTVPCQVCGVWVVSVCLRCSCGGVSSACSPLVVVEEGAIAEGRGARGGGGWHGERRAAVLPGSPSCARCPPSACWRPPSVRVVVLLNGGSGGVVCCPRVRIGSGTCIVPFPFTLFVPFVSFPFLFCLVLLCLLWVGKCGGGAVPRFPLLLPTVCVCCHSIVGLGLCLCGRVVSLWNSGDGCGGGRVCGVYCLLSTVNSLCVVGVCGLCCGLCCGLWNGGGG